MTLKEYLLWIFEDYYKGKSHSIKRAALLKTINLIANVQNFPSLKCTDREMRQAYEDLPICGSSKGLYLPETKAEIDEQIALHMKKIFSYWKKIKVLRKYKIESDSDQKNLF